MFEQYVDHQNFGNHPTSMPSTFSDPLNDRHFFNRDSTAISKVSFFSNIERGLLSVNSTEIKRLNHTKVFAHKIMFYGKCTYYACFKICIEIKIAEYYKYYKSFS